MRGLVDLSNRKAVIARKAARALLGPPAVGDLPRSRNAFSALLKLSMAQAEPRVDAPSAISTRKVKEFKRIAMRSDKTDSSFSAAIHLL